MAAMHVVWLQEVGIGITGAAEVEADLAIGGGWRISWVTHGFTGSLMSRAFA
jgi:hypothetical protein